MLAVGELLLIQSTGKKILFLAWKVWEILAWIGTCHEVIYKWKYELRIAIPSEP